MPRTAPRMMAASFAGVSWEMPDTTLARSTPGAAEEHAHAPMHSDLHISPQRHERPAERLLPHVRDTTGLKGSAAELLRAGVPERDADGELGGRWRARAWAAADSPDGRRVISAVQPRRVGGDDAHRVGAAHLHQEGALLSRVFSGFWPEPYS